MQTCSVSYSGDVLCCSEATALEIKWSYSAGLFFGAMDKEDLHGNFQSLFQASRLALPSVWFHRISGRSGDGGYDKPARF